jgi:hypothetical protein
MITVALQTKNLISKKGISLFYSTMKARTGGMYSIFHMQMIQIVLDNFMHRYVRSVTDRNKEGYVPSTYVTDVKGGRQQEEISKNPAKLQTIADAALNGKTMGLIVVFNLNIECAELPSPRLNQQGRIYEEVDHFKRFKVSALAKYYYKGSGHLSSTLRPEINVNGTGFKDLYYENKTGKVHYLHTSIIVSLHFLLRLGRETCNAPLLSVCWKQNTLMLIWKDTNWRGEYKVVSPLTMKRLNNFQNQQNSRHVRMALFDGNRPLGNIHTISALCATDNEATWRFSTKVSYIRDLVISD